MTLLSPFMKHVVAAPLLWLLAGCALRYDGKYDFDDGWRDGKILELNLASNTASPVRDDCRTQLSESAQAATRFATIRYRNNHFWRLRVVLAPPESEVKVGDTVLFNLRDCRQPLETPSSGAGKAPSEELVPLWERTKKK